MIFCNKFGVKTFFRATVANANIGSLKSLPTVFDTCLAHVVVKFEHNRMVRNM